MPQLLRKLRRVLLNEDPKFCDMFADERARRAGEEYLVHIRRHLRECFGDRRLRIVDAGCQAGRFLIPLATDGHELIGVDTSAFALRRAAQHAEEAGVQVRLYRGSIAKLSRWIQPGSLDAALCLEVLYLCPDYRALLKTLVDAVRPGGLLCVSHRPAEFYIASVIARREVDQLPEIFRRHEGPLADGRYYNWQTPAQLDALYRGYGMTMVACDPVDHAARRLDGYEAILPQARALLEALRPTDSTFQIPQYLLVIAKKAGYNTADC
mgnify:CR=1 FL=1